jgi:DNA-damage-inducible protein D
MAENKFPQELSPFQPDIRRHWYNNEWYYSIVDIVGFLTDSKDPSSYWRTLKKRLIDSEGAQETFGHIQQLIPSPKAEPFKLWLAQVGEERFEEIEHPEQAIERVRQTYRAKGYDDAWIEERIKNDLIRNELTDEWKDRGAKEGTEFAILTNTIHEGTFEVSIQAHKKYKLLPAKAGLRDHMTPLELALTSLSEATAITLQQDRDSQGFTELKRDATDAGEAGGEARKVIEKRVGKPIVSPKNFLENTKRQQQKRIERQQQPSLFDKFNESEDNL